MTLIKQYDGRKFIDSKYYRPSERYIAGSSRNRIWLYTVDRAEEFTRDDASNGDSGNVIPTGKTILRIVRWRARNDSKNKDIRYWRTGGRNGGSYNIRSEKEWIITSEIVNKLIGSELSDLNCVPLPEEEYVSLVGQKDNMAKLNFEIERIRTLEASRQAALKSYKKKITLIKDNIKKYKNILMDFQLLVESGDTSETDVHGYIEEKKPFWLFGLEYVDMDSHVGFPPGKKEYEFDLMLQRHDDFWDLVELKGPNENLFDKRTQRRNKPNKVLSEAIGQVFTYLHICDTIKLKDILKPKAIIVIGKDSTDKLSERRIFSSYLNNIELITYTELLERGKKLLEYVKVY